MPVPQLDVFQGAEIRELIDSLEKQRKELMFILENLDTDNVNGFDGSVINAGQINGQYLNINSDTTFEDGYDPNGLRTEMNTQFTVIDGQIQSKVATTTFNLLGTRVSSTEAQVTVMVGQINLKASSASVSALESRTNTAELNINGLNASINLKAEATTVNALGTRVNSAEININGLNSSISSKVSQTDYNGNTIVSMINQTPSFIEINAAKINLIGAVTVLSDISGNLGSITAGRINIYEDASIGAGLTLRGQGTKTGLYMDQAQITAQSGVLQLYGLKEIAIGSFTKFSGQVDFRGCTVLGL